MPEKKICQSCRHYQPGRTADFERGWCKHPEMLSPQLGLHKPITEARALCDKEGDGIFVHFEPAARAIAA